MAEPETYCGHCGGPLVVRETDLWCPIDGWPDQGYGAPPSPITGLLRPAHNVPHEGAPDKRVVMMARVLCPTYPPCQACVDQACEGLAHSLSRAMYDDVEEIPRG